MAEETRSDQRRRKINYQRRMRDRERERIQGNLQKLSRGVNVLAGGDLQKGGDQAIPLRSGHGALHQSSPSPMLENRRTMQLGRKAADLKNRARDGADSAGISWEGARISAMWPAVSDYARILRRKSRCFHLMGSTFGPLGSRSKQRCVFIHVSPLLFYSWFGRRGYYLSL